MKDKPIKVQLPCCAMFQLVCSNNNTIKELQDLIDKARHEAKYVWNRRDRTSGERSCFAIVAPGEDILERNLKTLGFTCLKSGIPRRNGYPGGELKMYFLQW